MLNEDLVNLALFHNLFVYIGFKAGGMGVQNSTSTSPRL